MSDKKFLFVNQNRNDLRRQQSCFRELKKRGLFDLVQFKRAMKRMHYTQNNNTQHSDTKRVTLSTTSTLINWLQSNITS